MAPFNSNFGRAHESDGGCEIQVSTKAELAAFCHFGARWWLGCQVSLGTRRGWYARGSSTWAVGATARKG
ncbi:hypothetical protein ES332_D06G075800v1 [Gossypium tomentosum]|uniref:Uncharacterized protein n=1 Tax=Gossypium tomentosum TaxID=34277 RepID=A0A5D2KEX9_GOSTO|nr:hypothetical protein ES332_D06G075800v1 [Gossypium tomentosum]